ncbi:MAG TPA: site-2 protease family protein [Pirellulales bacterium]|nr:site-2 protease family protein [Pirellulales bacterium]
MRDLLSWNISLGRWAGVQVRLHVFFVLFALVAAHLSARDHLAETLLALGVLFLCVLLHEFAHCFAAWQFGGSADQILLWPLGGLAQVNVSHEPQHELCTALAGPALNLFLCAITAPLIWAFRQDGVQEFHALLNPLLTPAAVAGLGWIDVFRWTFWINWLLLLVNLLPALPLDGGRALRSLLWPRWGFKNSVLAVAFAAKLMAAGLCLAAWWTHDNENYAYAALPLLLLAVLLYFSAKHETDRLCDGDPDNALFGYDFSQGYTSLEHAGTTHKPSPGLVRNWLDERRAARLLRQQQIEAEEERRVDDVLARLHKSGLHTLSDEDRALLDRVSARYRNRPRG